MSHDELFPVTTAQGAGSSLDAEALEAERRRAASDPEGFWREVGGRLDWMRPFTKIKDVSFRRDDFRIRWFEDGILNVAYNCLDRHLE